MSHFLSSLIGLTGGSAFSYAALPAAVATMKKGQSIGTPISIAWAIITGTILMYIYVLISFGFDWVMTINYVTEFLTWAVIVKYHYLPRKA